MANLLSNINKETPRWYKRLKRAVNIGLVPVAVLTIKGLWVGSDTQLNRVLIVITVTIPGLMEFIGMLMSDGEQEITEPPNNARI